MMVRLSKTDSFLNRPFAMMIPAKRTYTWLSIDDIDDIELHAVFSPKRLSSETHLHLVQAVVELSKHIS